VTDWLKIKRKISGGELCREMEKRDPVHIEMRTGMLVKVSRLSIG